MMMMKREKNVSVVMMMMMVMMVLWSCMVTTKGQRNSTKTRIDVGVVLDMKTLFGKMGLTTLQVAISDFYASNPHFNTRIVLHTRDSDSDVVLAAASAIDLIKNMKVQAIIGPESSMQAHFVTSIGTKAQIPIITFSAKSPTLASLRSPFFFRFAANDSSQAGAVAAVVKAFGWRQAVPIYVQNEYGEGIVPYLTDALQSVDVRVPYRSPIPPEASDDLIAAELYKLMTMSTRVFVVHMLPELGSRIFAAAERIGMMSRGYAWIVSDGIADFLSSQNATVLESMQGVIGVKTYVPRSERLESLAGRWRSEFRRRNQAEAESPPLVVFGLWAYDTVFALAAAVEETSKGGGVRFGFTGVKNSSSLTDLGSLPVSTAGMRLAEALSAVRFRGVSGDFRLVNGQLETPNFEIVNVNGNGERQLGFWTPTSGLSRTLGPVTNTTRKSSYSASNTSLRPIIWPGDSTSAPKGWQIPTNGKILKIGVPVKEGFVEFVNVSSPFSNDTVSGYCVDVFRAVLWAMPYSVPFEFVPFVDGEGKYAGSYNDLVYQVYTKKFDGVVGDVTIRANRSLYVDFTLPFTESGVSMIVPMKDYKSKNEWAFAKPLTWDLWLASGCFFIFIGFMVWVLEHRINYSFRGSVPDQIGTSLWYSFSTMVFGHRESVESNWARFVVIIWCFVVLILTQSYTASLTSRLTVQQLLPTITDVNQLLRNLENVGYQKGSFVLALLQQMGFKENQLKIYNSPEELYNLFQKGTAKNGISAAFDETPYLKLFLARYCSKFTLLEPTFKADGFGFVFPKGSPLVPDISRAILQVTEGQQMKDIEAVWFKKEPSCPDPSNKFSSNSLGLESFWGLFLITGLASGIAFLCTIGMFLYEQRDKLRRPGSVWTNVTDVIEEFHKFDHRSPTLRRIHARDTTLSRTNGPVSPFPVDRDTSPEPGPSSIALTEHDNVNTNGARTGNAIEGSNNQIELATESQVRPHTRG